MTFEDAYHVFLGAKNITLNTEDAPKFFSMLAAKEVFLKIQIKLNNPKPGKTTFLLED